MPKFNTVLLQRPGLWLALLLALTAFVARTAALRQPAPVATVSAASFEAAVAPDSIAALFGSGLANGTFPAPRGQALPTQLGAPPTMVEVNGQAAPLFFASPGQVNYLIPAATPLGVATVQVKLGGVIVGSGSVTVQRTAPALFAANANGAGVPAATLLRAFPNGLQRFEPLAEFDSATRRFRPFPIELGAASEKVFLVLYLTGLRGAEAGTVRVVLGGEEYTPGYASVAPGFIGLDQINQEVPRSLLGRGVIELAINIAGVGSSNLGQIEIAAQQGPAPPLINNFTPASALVREQLTINGAGFSATAAENTIRIAETETRTIEAAAVNQLVVRVPFYAESGRVSVATGQGVAESAATLLLRTSLSSEVEDTEGNPLPGVKARITSPATPFVESDNEGVFIVPDAPVGDALTVELDPSGLPFMPPFDVPKLPKLPVLANRDNHYGPIPLQPIIGPSLTVGGASFTSEAADAFAPAGSIETGGIRFDLADNATAIFPGGATSGRIYLTQVANSRTPVPLPRGVFSSSIVQLSPFGVRLTPGGKLTFPNRDNLQPADRRVNLYRLELDPRSRFVGEFVIAGTATLSADGSVIETAANAITETSIFFAALPRPTTTVIGRVVESNGVTPVRNAQVRVRGQQGVTDGNGGFIIRHVPVNAVNDQIIVDINFTRPNGRVERTQARSAAIVVNGLTKLTASVPLPPANANRAPGLIVAERAVITVGRTLDLSVFVTDPDAGQTLQVSLNGPSFAALLRNGNQYLLRLAPSAAGTFAATLTVSDNGAPSLRTTKTVALVVNNNQQCSYAIQPISQSFPASGGGGSVGVTTANGCPWAAQSEVGWLTITAGASGNGNGVVNFNVAANATTNPRTGRLIIAGQNFTVNQDGALICPTVSGSAPTSGLVGTSVIINGSGFTGVTSVRFTNNVNAAFTINSDAQITTTVPAGAVTGPLTLNKPNCVATQTGVFTVITPNPTPALTSLTPNAATAGGAGFTLTLAGTGFVNGSVVRWNNSNRPTTFVNATRLAAAIPASDLSTAGTASVTVFNPAPGGGVSNALGFTINCPTIALNPAQLPTATASVAYSQTITASPAGGGYSFTASGLPQGLSLSSSGLLAGAPATKAGVYNFTVTATGFGACSGSRNYALTVVCPTITLNPASLPNGMRGAAYNQTLSASGGAAPYTFSLTSGALPPGLTLSSTGTISGTPSANAVGTFTFTVGVSDANSCTGARQYTLTMNSSLVSGLRN